MANPPSFTTSEPTFDFNSARTPRDSATGLIFRLGDESASSRRLSRKTSPRKISVSKRDVKVDTASKVDSEGELLKKRPVSSSPKRKFKVSDPSKELKTKDLKSDDEDEVKFKLDLYTAQEFQRDFIQSQKAGTSQVVLSARFGKTRIEDVKSIYKNSYPMQGINSLNPNSESPKKRNKKLIEDIDRAWLLTKKPTGIVKRTNNVISDSIAKEVDALYEHEKIDFTDFIVTESDRGPLLLDLIQRGVAFQCIIERVKLLLSMLDEYLHNENMKTEASSKLYEYLNRFFLEDLFLSRELNKQVGQCKPNDVELVALIRIYDEVLYSTQNKKDAKYLPDDIKRLIFSTLGDTPEEVSDVMAMLRKWAGQSTQEQLRLCNEINERAWELSRASYLISRISEIKHHKIQYFSHYQGPLANISCNQIAMMLDTIAKGASPFSCFKVDDSVFWDSKKKRFCSIRSRSKAFGSSEPDKTTQAKSKELYNIQNRLPNIKEVSENLLMLLSRKKVIDQTILFQGALFNAARDSSFEFEDVEKEIPKLGLLGYATNIGWNDGEEYITKLYPELNQFPYSTKFEGHWECLLNTFENRVTHIREMSIYKDLGNNKDLLLEAKLLMACRLEPIEKGCKTTVWIDKSSQLGTSWNEIRPKIVATAKVEALPDTPDGVTYSTDVSDIQISNTLRYKRISTQKITSMSK